MLLCAGGCGQPEGARVWGKVSYNGIPVERGTILFEPVDETRGPSTGGKVLDGAYEIDARGGPLPGGVYRVRISASKETGKVGSSKRYGQYKESVSLIPPEYDSRSTLKVTISAKPGENEFDFRLTGK
jgi:hypothetical protein